jgi:hypothetical protein
VTAYVFGALAAAQACAPVVDAQQGYPRPGVEVGGGAHVKDAGGGPFVTATYAVPIKHPTLAQWAYLADAISTPALTPQAVALSLPAPTSLDATWFPVPT